jgi:hypothetical protein
MSCSCVAVGDESRAISEYVEFRISEQLQLYVPPVLLLAGTLGNVLSFSVLMRRSMRATCTYNYLAALALLDTLVLYGDCLVSWLPHVMHGDPGGGGSSHKAALLLNHSDWLCKLLTMLVYSVSVSSVWLLIGVTVDRYIATTHALHASTMCVTPRRALRVIGGVLLLASLLHAHFLFTMGLHAGNCQSLARFQYLVEVVWPWIDGILYCFAPFLIIATLNSFIIAQVLRSTNQRQKQLVKQPHGSPAARSSEKHVTVMLLAVSFSFLACTLPTAVFMIYKSSLGPLASLPPYLLARLILAKTLCKFLLYTNHGINFYLYLLSGQRFRREMWAMVRCGKQKQLQRSKYCYTAAIQNNKREVN